MEEKRVDAALSATDLAGVATPSDSLRARPVLVRLDVVLHDGAVRVHSEKVWENRLVETSSITSTTGATAPPIAVSQSRASTYDVTAVQTNSINSAETAV